jgi:hypothetical protein
MMNTFQNAAQVLSIGFFFALITIGMATTLPSRLTQALQGQGVSSNLSHTVGNTPPLDSLFSAFLGENPITTLNKQFNGALLTGRTPAQVSNLTGRGFFSKVLSEPFGTGLHYALYFAVACSLVAAVASLLRGKKYLHGMHDQPAPATAGDPGVEPVAADDTTAVPELVGVGASRFLLASTTWSPAGASGTSDSGGNRSANGHQARNGHATPRPTHGGGSTPPASSVSRDGLPMAQAADGGGAGRTTGPDDRSGGDGSGERTASWSWGGATDGTAAPGSDGGGPATAAAPVERAVPEVVDPGQAAAAPDGETTELSVTVSFRLTSRPGRRRNP